MTGLAVLAGVAGLAAGVSATGDGVRGQSPDRLAWFGAGLLVISLATVGLQCWGRLGIGWLPVLAILRAAVQLAVIAVLLSGVLTTPWLLVAFLVLMLSTASWTAMSRLKELWGGRRAAWTGVLAGGIVGVGVVLGLHLVAWEPRYIISVAGILIGNAMTAATLSGRNFLSTATARGPEVEGWLALGATPSVAWTEVGRNAARESLLPTLDQTKATGLVTLPGAFVGALFGGADPVTAAQFQLVVLAGIGLTMTVTALVVVKLAGRSPVVPQGR